MQKISKNILNLQEQDIDKIIKSCYGLLNLITFYTVKGNKEIRAFAIPKNTNILKAAQELHSDFSEKFIKAEVININDLINNKSRPRTKGKDYLVKQGDVIEFKI